MKTMLENFVKSLCKQHTLNTDLVSIHGYFLYGDQYDSDFLDNGLVFISIENSFEGHDYHVCEVHEGNIKFITDHYSVGYGYVLRFFFLLCDSSGEPLDRMSIFGVNHGYSWRLFDGQPDIC